MCTRSHMSITPVTHLLSIHTITVITSPVLSKCSLFHHTHTARSAQPALPQQLLPCISHKDKSLNTQTDSLPLNPKGCSPVTWMIILLLQLSVK